MKRRQAKNEGDDDGHRAFERWPELIVFDKATEMTKGTKG
jgi:hypothetical protein